MFYLYIFSGKCQCLYFSCFFLYHVYVEVFSMVSSAYTFVLCSIKINHLQWVYNRFPEHNVPIEIDNVI